MHSTSQYILYFCLSLCTSLGASIGTSWTENPSDPIYSPFAALSEDYFPCVIYNKDRFLGDGDAVYYKMWHQGPNDTIALSYSNDGIAWTLKAATVVPAEAFHPCVVYDPKGFGTRGAKYKMWFWNGVASLTVDAILCTTSVDGINWAPAVPVTQDPDFPLAVGVAGQFFYHLYGPGFVKYNPSATSRPGRPYTYPYIMFFDTATEGFGPGTSQEQIGLAYSSDGISWTRYGTGPVLIPSGDVSDWDGSHVYRPSLVQGAGAYHLYYSGSNGDSSTGLFYAHGLGHAISTDGISWIRDSSNPIFISTDGVAWRNDRSYTPFVLLDKHQDQNRWGPYTLKMWFTGGTGLYAGMDQGIGYATVPISRY